VQTRARAARFRAARCIRNTCLAPSSWPIYPTNPPHGEEERSPSESVDEMLK